jgi:hypothetical protein
MTACLPAESQRLQALSKQHYKHAVQAAAAAGPTAPELALAAAAAAVELQQRVLTHSFMHTYKTAKQRSPQRCCQDQQLELGMHWL